MSNDIRFRHKRDFQSYSYWRSETDAFKYLVDIQESTLENNKLLEKTVFKNKTHILMSNIGLINFDNSFKY